MGRGRKDSDGVGITVIYGGREEEEGWEERKLTEGR